MKGHRCSIMWEVLKSRFTLSLSTGPSAHATCEHVARILIVRQRLDALSRVSFLAELREQFVQPNRRDLPLLLRRRVEFRRAVTAQPLL